MGRIEKEFALVRVRRHFRVSRGTISAERFPPARDDLFPSAPHSTLRVAVDFGAEAVELLLDLHGTVRPRRYVPVHHIVFHRPHGRFLVGDPDGGEVGIGFVLVSAADAHPFSRGGFACGEDEGRPRRSWG